MPQLQQAIEAHTFHRGGAYREGGDEFITILPNMSEDQAQAHLTDLQQRLNQVRYRLKLKERPTISVGLTTVSPESFLATREIRELANAALQEAKEQGGNAVIASQAEAAPFFPASGVIDSAIGDAAGSASSLDGESGPSTSGAG